MDHVINVYKRFYKKNLKTLFRRSYSLNVFFYFQQAKITQISSPDSSNIGNVLTIKDNGI